MNINKLIDIIKSYNKNKVIIQLHRVPDPDAIGCGVALKKILKANGIDSEIVHHGSISKIETNKLIESSCVELINLDRYRKKYTKDDLIVLVDCQYNQSNSPDLGGNYIACIDHHQENTFVSYEYKDIREDYGACATIMVEYLNSLNLNIEEDLAILLLYGIKIDTLDLTREAIEQDTNALCQLYKSINLKQLQIIMKDSLKLEEVADYKEALRNMEIHNELCITYTGSNKSAERLATIADFLLSIDSVEFVIVFTELADGIKISVRSSSDKWNAGEVIYKALKGYGDGGGHSQMAGGFIPSRNLINVGDISDRFTLILNNFSKVMFS